MFIVPVCGHFSRSFIILDPWQAYFLYRFFKMYENLKWEFYRYLQCAAKNGPIQIMYKRLLCLSLWILLG